MHGIGDAGSVRTRDPTSQPNSTARHRRVRRVMNDPEHGNSYSIAGDSVVPSTELG